MKQTLLLTFLSICSAMIPSKEKIKVQFDFKSNGSKLSDDDILLLDPIFGDMFKPAK